jgi:hypothetical protein
VDKTKLSKLSKRVKGSSGESGRNKPIGTPHAHYAGPEQGPFKCENCAHQTGGLCSHPDVIEDARAGSGGLTIVKDRAQINAAGCCNYFRKR